MAKIGHHKLSPKDEREAPRFIGGECQVSAQSVYILNKLTPYRNLRFN